MRSNTMIDKKTNRKNKNTLTRGYVEKINKLRKGKKKGKMTFILVDPFGNSKKITKY
jgi:C4-type Zn-finger protein